jgi:YlmC/YmxH family sporulation protein
MGGMYVVKISELKQREVININDGRRLGIVYDVEIDMEKGRIDAIVIPGTGRVLGLFSKESDIVVNWENIKKIGTDVILIDGGGY